MVWKRSKYRRFNFIAVTASVFALAASMNVLKGTTLQIVQDENNTEITENELYLAEPVDGIKIDKNEVLKEANKYDYSDRVEKASKKDNKSKDNTPNTRRKKKVNTFWTGSTGRNTAYLLALVALGIILFFIVTKLSPANLSIATANSDIRINDNISKESLKNLDTDAALQYALDQADYRLALRILYLKNLKMLMSLGWIEPAKEKTNSDYFREIKDVSCQKEFGKLCVIFDYTWYGNAMPSRTTYREYKVMFEEFYNQVRLK